MNGNDSIDANTADGLLRKTVEVAPSDSKQIARRQVVPKFVVLLAVFITVYVSVYVLFAFYELKHRGELWEISMRNRIVLAIHDIESTFRTVSSDVAVLAQSSSVQQYIAGERDARERLTADMRNFAIGKGLYDQARFVGTDNVERIRVDYRNGRATVVDDAQLQDKSQRYYLAGVDRMRPGEIQVSALDLNVEHGQIEKPFKPVIRFVTPVFDTSGEFHGSIILNYLASDLLNRFEANFRDESGRAMLLNPDGFWLSSPHAEDEWGFMFPDKARQTFRLRHPEAWASMQSRRAGTYSSDGQIFVFAEIDPLWSAYRQQGSTATPTSQASGEQPARFPWYAVVGTKPTTVVDLLSEFNWFVALISGLFLSGIGAWFIASDRLRQSQWKTHVQQQQQELEARVIARTKQLRQTTNQIAMVLDSTAEGICGIDALGRCTFVNSSALQLLGFRNELDLLGQNLQTLIFPRDKDGISMGGPIDELLTHGTAIQLDDCTMLCADGNPISTEIRLRPITGHGDIVGGVISFSDITTRKMEQQRIRTLSQAIEQSPVSVVITDSKAHIEYVNRRYERITGYSASEVIGKNPKVVKSGNMPSRIYKQLWSSLGEGRTWVGEFENRHKNGDLYWVRAYIAPVFDDKGELRHLLGIEEDITQAKLHEETIQQQANYDFLTQLPNRTLAMSHLEQQIQMAGRRGQQLGVLFLDIDDFKRVNDTLGHSVGDRLLVDAAERLRDTVRGQDTVARLGGDEFLVTLGVDNRVPETGLLAKKLLDEFRVPFLIEQHEIVLTISIGTALFPQDANTANDLLRNADIAMYQAKKIGRNTHEAFAPSMNLAVTRRLSLEARLRGALQRSELIPHYQPIIRLEDGRTVGCEALMRWRDGEFGQVSPAEFIPIAEQTGLIDVIGRFALAESMRRCADFRQRFGDDFYVSVNASPAQFRDSDFAEQVQLALDAAELPGNALLLEITEGVLLSGYPFLAQTLEDLHAMGVRLAMDDFGTGYASLSYLRRYPFDVLKIDREFISDIGLQDDRCTLIKTALQMGKALGMTVVAEGVETPQQRDALQEWGCDLAQGYLFGRPVSAEQFGGES